MTTEFRTITRPDGSRKAAYRSVKADGTFGPWHRTTLMDAEKSLRQSTPDRLSPSVSR
jgi:hypothetical protein